MIKKSRTKKSPNQVKISFVLPGDDARLPASVVGDFNRWTPGVDVFKLRSNGFWSAVVAVESNREYRFRYRSDTGQWFNEESPDRTEVTEFGSENCVVLT